ncbi:MAG: hypothetical protein QM733_03075 [Ilumatobacteraceae bacterium]
MSGLNPQAMAVLRQHHGVATITMLREAGIGRKARERLVDDGVLIQRFERVVQIASSPVTVESRCAELCLAYPRGFITGLTGGRLVGLRRMGSGDPIELSLRHGANIGPIQGVRLRQTTAIEPVDVQARRADGIRLASVPRLVFDLGADLPQRDHASVVEQVLHERRCTYATLLSTARRLMHAHRPGSLVVAATLMQRGERAAAESHGELDLGEALRRAGVPVVPQVRSLELPNGRRIRLDLAVPEIRWGIEVDLHPDHLLLQGTTSDKRRDRQCHLIGWQIERVAELDLADPEGLVTELKALYLTRVANSSAA